MTSSYDAFFYWLGQKESGDLKKPYLVKPADQYAKVNTGRYIGKYQVGTEMLHDIGYYKLRDDKDRKNQWRGTWLGKNNIWSRVDFLVNPRIQEIAAREEMKKLWGYI